MDYGAPVGFRLAAKHPERVESLIIQNGNAYVEGIDNDFWEPIKEYWKDRGAINQGLDNDFWKNVKAAYKQPNMSNEDALRFLVTLGATQWQYTNGVRNEETISPGQLARYPETAGPARKRGDSASAVLRLRQQSSTLSELAGVLSPAPATDVDRLGRE